MPTPDFIPNGDFDCDKDYTLYYESIEDCEHFWKYHARTNLSPEVVKGKIEQLLSLVNYMFRYKLRINR